MTTDLIDVHLDGIVFAEIPLGGISRMWTNIINQLPDHGCRVHLYLPPTNVRNIQFDDRVKHDVCAQIQVINHKVNKLEQADFQRGLTPAQRRELKALREQRSELRGAPGSE